MVIERTYRVDTRDVDHQGQCRPSAVLGFLQETATVAAWELGFAREIMLEKYHCFWMMVRVWFQLDTPLLWNQEVTVRTWHRMPKGATNYRDFDLFVDGKRVGQAVSAWVMADYDTHRIHRLDGVEELARGREELDDTKPETLSRLKLPGSMEPVEQRRLHYSETDMNAHVNNTRYADFACDVLRLENLAGGAFVSGLQISFQAECQAGDVLDLAVGREGDTHFVQGVGRDGRARFEASIALAGL